MARKHRDRITPVLQADRGVDDQAFGAADAEVRVEEDDALAGRGGGGGGGEGGMVCGAGLGGWGVCVVWDGKRGSRGVWVGLVGRAEEVFGPGRGGRMIPQVGIGALTGAEKGR